MTLLYAYKNRTFTTDLVINDPTGDRTPEVDDGIRITIGHESKLDDSGDLSDAELVVVDNAPTSNGSTFTKAVAPAVLNRLRLDNLDLTFPAGVYSLIFDFRDASDGNDWKNVSRQVIVIEES